ncbi:MAG: Virginiamycin B lyase [Ktedonobacterales bacterium]
MDTFASPISHRRSRRLGSATKSLGSVVLLLAISMQLAGCTSSPKFHQLTSTGTPTATAAASLQPCPFPAQGSVAPNHVLSGHIALFALPDLQAQVRGITSGPDGAIWFSAFDWQTLVGSIGRITSDCHLTEFSLGSHMGPWAITLGPDGNLWFAGDLDHQVGRITPQGAITYFPDADSPAEAIITGPDGNLWLSEPGSGDIARLTPSGHITQFHVPYDPTVPTEPKTTAEPWYLTAGPDGAVWFTETEGNQVGRITPSGSITQFHTPTTSQLFGRALGGITTGPDHALWFAESGYDGDQGRIARMTTSGAFHDYPLAQNSETPTTVVAGPDGALWYTEFLHNIGRITVAGAVSEFPLPGDLDAATMCVGPDHTLWFGANTANYGGQIGRLV